MDVLAGSTDVTTYFALRLAADGTEATGLTITNIDLQYTRSGAAPSTKVDATALAATDSAHGDNQAIEIDATDQPGLYRVDWPDAAFAAGVREVILTVKCATCFTEHLRVNLTPVPANVEQWNATSVPSEHTAGYPIVTIKDGTGTGEINTNAGAIALVDLVTTTTTATNVTTVNGLAANVITAAATHSDFGTEIGTAVWASATRTLTAGTNIDGSTFTAIPWNASWDAEVQSEVEDALVVHRLDELLNADSDIDGAAPPTVGSVFHELMSKTAGSFTFDQTTDSLEAIRDRGDAAWLTAAGFSTHSAADVWAVGTRTLTALDEDSTTLDLDATIRAAVGLASANLDTQLDALPTAAEGATAVWAAGTRTLTAGTNIDGSTFTAIPWNASWDAEVQSEVQDALEANNLDHLVKLAVDTDWATTVHLNSVLGHIADNGTTATFDRTTDSLEAMYNKSVDVETDTQDIQGRLPAALVSGRIDASVGAYQSGLTPLQPTVSGRTLDVSAGGEAGIDWANVGSPTTSVGLTGTTISTSQVAASVTGNVGGNVTGSVGSIATGGIAAASFASGAINAAALAADAIDEIWDEAMTELSAVPGVTASLRDAIRWLFLLARNKITQTSTTQTLRNDADSANVGTSTVSDDGSTFTRGEWS